MYIGNFILYRTLGISTVLQLLLSIYSCLKNPVQLTRALYNQFYFTFPVCKCILADIQAVNDLVAWIHAILMDIYTLD